MNKRIAFPDTVPSQFIVTLQALSARLFRASPGLRAKAAAAGQMADFVAWQERTFGRQLDLYGRREKLWEQCHRLLDPQQPLFVLEFGVAHGYATHWWLSRLGPDVTWHGFDRFTGLPRAWNAFGEGAFSNGGEPPAMDYDPRVRWHVGNVEDTLKSVDIAAGRAGAQWLILFDLDIYEPTAFAWDVIAEYLQPGDVIYLDEAFDHDERRVLDDMILPSIRCEPVAATPASLALMVT